MQHYISLPGLSEGFCSPKGIFQMGVVKSTLTPEIIIICTFGGECFWDEAQGCLIGEGRLNGTKKALLSDLSHVLKTHPGCVRRRDYLQTLLSNPSIQTAAEIYICTRSLQTSAPAKVSCLHSNSQMLFTFYKLHAHVYSWVPRNRAAM